MFSKTKKLVVFLVISFLGAAVCNNVFAATGLISGKVTKSADVTAISGASVKALQNDTVISETSTDAGGNYSISLSTGKYKMQVIHPDYISQVNPLVTVNTELTTTVNFSLLSGQVVLFDEFNQGSLDTSKWNIYLTGIGDQSLAVWMDPTFKSVVLNSGYGGAGSAVITSKDTVSVSSGTVIFEGRIAAYEDNNTAYGDGQPRGLRAGTDGNNAIEFISISGSSIRTRTVRGGIATTTDYSLGESVYQYKYVYRIEAYSTQVKFYLNNNLIATHTTNIPTGVLNIYLGTNYSGGGNANVGADYLLLGTQLGLITPPTTGSISANIYYSGSNSDGNLVVLVGTGTYGTATWGQVASDMILKGSYYLPAYSNFYDLTTRNYTLVAGIDLNQNGQLEVDSEPVVQISNITIDQNNTYQYRDVYLKAPGQTEAKVSGNISYYGSNWDGDLKVMIGTGTPGVDFQPKYATTFIKGTYWSPVFYEFVNVPDGNWTVIAGVDKNSNGSLETEEPVGQCAGINITGGQSQLSKDVSVYAPTIGGEDGYIYGYINYEEPYPPYTLKYYVYVNVKPEWNIVPVERKSMMIGPSFAYGGFYYSFYNLSYSNFYYVFAWLDKNNDNIPDADEPQGSAGPISVADSYGTYKNFDLVTGVTGAGANKISGQILSSIPTSWDRLIVGIGMGEMGPDWKATKKQTFDPYPNGITFPVSYILDNIPDDTDTKNYNLYAGFDMNWDGRIDMYEPVFKSTMPFGVDGVVRGSITITGIDVTIPAQKLGGNITNANNYTAPLMIRVGKGQPGTNEFINSAKMQKMDYHNWPSFWYEFKFIEPATNYYVFAGIDENYNGQIEENEPKGMAGPVTIQAGTEWTYVSDITLSQAVTGELTGTNSIQGNVYFSGSKYDKIYITVGPGNQNGIFDSTKRTTTLWGPGWYNFTNLPNGTSYYAKAYMDTNYNNIQDPGEPISDLTFVGSLSGDQTITKDITLNVAAPTEVSTMTVSIVGKVLKGVTRDVMANIDDILGGAIVYLYDTGGWNDWSWENDKLIAITTATSIQTGSGYNGYNFQFPNIQVKVSNPSSGMFYNYRIKASSTGYDSADFNTSFDAFQANTSANIGQLTLYPKIGTSLSNFEISPSTISPDNDGVNDRARVTFKYTANTTIPTREIEGNVKLVIDSNGDGEFVPVNYGLFIWVDNKQFMKWNYTTNLPDPTIFIEWDQFGKPKDYTNLKGPLTQEEVDRYMSKFDVTIEQWINTYNMFLDNNKLSTNMEMWWEGKDASWRNLKNGTYSAKLFLIDNKSDLVATYPIGTITVKTNSFTGKLIDESSAPVSGARVTAGSPSCWSETFSGNDGRFEVSGLRAGSDFYHVEIMSDKYIMETRDNVQIPTDTLTKDLGTITLRSGVELSGTITILNPPKAGDILDPYSGNLLYDMWGGVEVWRVDGPGWNRKEFRIQLTTYTIAERTEPYQMFLSPGKYQMSAKMPGYVSQTEELYISEISSFVVKNITLDRASSLKGLVIIPPGISGDVNININAESLDFKSRSWANVWFVQGSTASYFLLDNLLPDTSYYLRFESFGNLAKKEIVTWIQKGDNYREEIVQMNLGSTMEGKLVVKNDIAPYLPWWTMQGVPEPGKARIWIDANSLADYTHYGTDVIISTFSLIYPTTYTYYLRGLSSGTYEVNLWMESIDVTIPSRIVVVPETTTTPVPVTGPTIYLERPSAVLSGKVKNSTGKAIDFSKVKVSVVVPEKGEPRVIDVISDGSFVAGGMQSGLAIVWGNEYDIPPVPQGVIFGKPTGNAGTFMAWANLQSGTTSTISLNLLPGSTIFITVNASTSVLKEIYDFEYAISTGGIVPGKNPFLPNFVRIQPLSLRKLGEEMEQKSAGKEEEKMRARDISFAALLADNDYSDGNLIFSCNGLEESIYYVYPMVNIPMYYGGQSGPNGYSPSVLTYKTYNYASTPAEHSVTLGSAETKSVSFQIGTGFTLSGTVSRPQTGADAIEISLRDPISNRVIISTTTRFASDSTLRTSSFEFKNLSGGKYALIIWSGNYKPYSQIIDLLTGDKNVGIIQLSKGASIVGKLTDEDGKAVVEGVIVECFAYPFVEGSYRNSEGFGISIATTGVAGRFTAANLPAGTYMVKVKTKADAKANYVNASVAGVSVPESQTEVDAGTIKLKKGTTISGKVTGVDESGNIVPLANILMMAYPVDPQLRENMESETQTDANGLYVLKGIAPETQIKYWEVKANVRSDDPSKQVKRKVQYGEKIKTNVTPGSTGIDFVLGVADAKVSGKIKTIDSGKLLLPFRIPGIDIEDFPAALVLFQSKDDLASGDPMSGAKILTKSEGDYLAEGLVPGRYGIKVFAKGYAPYALAYEVKSGTNTIPTITLRSGLKLQGSIRTSTGKKISSSDASVIVAANVGYTKIVMGALTSNPVSQEIESYEIVGLSTGVPYYLVLVEPKTKKVFVDPKTVTVDGSTPTVTRDIEYREFPPRFQAKVFKTRLPKLLLPYIFANIDTTGLDDTVNVYFLYAFTNEPLQESEVSSVISTTTQSGGLLLPIKMSDNHKEMASAYIAKGVDITNGFFVLKFSGHSSKGTLGETEFKFWIGEDGRNETLVNPMVGGSVTMGEGDTSGMELSAGCIEDEVAISSGMKAIISKVTSETIGETAIRKLSPRMFSSPQPAASSYPGDLASSIYDMKIQLLSGPLGSLALTKPVSVKLKISTTVAQADASLLDVYSYDGFNWVEETGSMDFDWTNFLLSIDVSHLTKFAVFKVQPGAPTAYTGPFKTYVYPNPVRKDKGQNSTTIKCKIPGTGKVNVKIKIYDLVGELVKTLKDTDDDGDQTMNNLSEGMAYDFTWKLKNDDGDAVASGVYIYMIELDDEVQKDHIRKIAVIK